PQTVMATGWITGNFGQPGRVARGSCPSRAGNRGPALVSAGSAGLPSIRNPIDDNTNDTEIWSAILTGKYTAGHQDIRDINIQLIYHGGNAVLQTRDGMIKGIEAHRKVEFVVSHAQFLTTNAR